MLKKLRPRSAYDVIALLALFVAMGGTAYAVDTIGSADIIDESIVSADLKNYGVKRSDIGLNSINTDRIENFSLNDEDVGQGTFVNFAAYIGTVSAHGCVKKAITGIGAQGDHLLLTPSSTSLTGIVYAIQYTSDVEHAWLQACNLASFAQAEGTMNFNLLVIDAQ